MNKTENLEPTLDIETRLRHCKQALEESNQENRNNFQSLLKDKNFKKWFDNWNKENFLADFSHDYNDVIKEYFNHINQENKELRELLEEIKIDTDEYGSPMTETYRKMKEHLR